MAIGLFDSGIGGLTVLKALKEKWPQQDFVYLADTARLPYGAKSLATIRHYVEHNVRFLQSFKLKALVIACNSASTAVLQDPITTTVPMFNVVEPGARMAAHRSTTHRIGVLGTRATVLSGAYPKQIQLHLKQAHVVQQACPIWVPLVEEGWVDDPITNLVVFRYVAAILRENVDTLVLGCTHYPVLTPAIRKACGPNIELVDSNAGLMEDLEKSVKPGQGTGRLHLMVTDDSPRTREMAQWLLGDHQITTYEAVDVIVP